MKVKRLVLDDVPAINPSAGALKAAGEIQKELNEQNRLGVTVLWNEWIATIIDRETGHGEAVRVMKALVTAARHSLIGNDEQEIKDQPILVELRKRIEKAEDWLSKYGSEV